MQLDAYCLDLARRAREASRALASASGAQKNKFLNTAAMQLRGNRNEIFSANEKDVLANGENLTAAQIDRLRLTPARVDVLAVGLHELYTLPDPIGKVLEGQVRPNGLE